jgi:nucleotide-binding universal stress UspA family protein
MTVQPFDQPGSSTGVAPVADPFVRLLVPIDFSSAARSALLLAMRIAERWGSEVILFHAAGLDGNDEFLDYTGVPWGRGDVVGESEGHLRRFADTVMPGSAARVQVDATRADDTVAAVVGACSRHKPSLIVLGSHPRGRHPFRRTRVERILRDIRCSVVIVRGDAEAPVDADM